MIGIYLGRYAPTFELRIPNYQITKSLISSAALVSVSFLFLACSNQSTTSPGQAQAQAQVKAETQAAVTASETVAKVPAALPPFITKVPVVEAKKPPVPILTDAQRATSLWKKIKGYKTWKSPPGFSGLVESDTIHGDFVRFYANGTALADMKNLPNGSIVVKEGFHDDEGDLKAITVMQKIDGSYGASGNWFFSRFDSAGNVSKINSKRCISCHSKDDNGDFSYAND